MEVRAGVTLHTVIRMAEEGVKVPSRVFITPLPVDGWMIDPDARLSEGFLAGIPPGEYLPVVNGMGMRGYALASVVYGGRTGPFAPIDVEAADSTVTLILTSKPGRISGTVRKGDQSPAPDSMIVLLPASTVDALGSIDLTNRGGRVKVGQILAFKPGEMTAASDAGGNFIFEDLAPASYNAIVLNGANRARFADPVFLRDRLSSAATVVVEAGATSNLEMRVQE